MQSVVRDGGSGLDIVERVRVRVTAVLECRHKERSLQEGHIDGDAYGGKTEYGRDDDCSSPSFSAVSEC